MLQIKHPQNILISGASSGIGRSLALAYSSPNINLFLCARNLENLKETKKLCLELQANVFIKILDVQNEWEVKSFIDEIEEKHQIDLLIANAGIAGEKDGVQENIAQAKNIFKTNVDGVMNFVYPVLEKMKKRQKGQIAIISSLAGICGIPSSPAYSASKAAIRVYAQSLRRNFSKYGINLNLICPGYVKTQMTQTNDFWMPFLIDSNKAAKIIKNGLEKNKAIIAFPFAIYVVLLITSILPNRFIDLIFAKFVK